jgi:hypothetical protein
MDVRQRDGGLVLEHEPWRLGRGGWWAFGGLVVGVGVGGAFVHSAWLGLTGLVGAGGVLAGLQALRVTRAQRVHFTLDEVVVWRGRRRQHLPRTQVRSVRFEHQAAPSSGGFGELIVWLDVRGEGAASRPGPEADLEALRLRYPASAPLLEGEVAVAHGALMALDLRPSFSGDPLPERAPPVVVRAEPALPEPPPPVSAEPALTEPAPPVVVSAEPTPPGTVPSVAVSAEPTLPEPAPPVAVSTAPTPPERVPAAPTPLATPASTRGLPLEVQGLSRRHRALVLGERGPPKGARFFADRSKPLRIPTERAIALALVGPFALFVMCATVGVQFRAIQGLLGEEGGAGPPLSEGFGSATLLIAVLIVMHRLLFGASRALKSKSGLGLHLLEEGVLLAIRGQAPVFVPWGRVEGVAQAGLPGMRTCELRYRDPDGNAARVPISNLKEAPSELDKAIQDGKLTAAQPSSHKTSRRRARR